MDADHVKHAIKCAF